MPFFCICTKVVPLGTEATIFALLITSNDISQFYLPPLIGEFINNKIVLLDMNNIEISKYALLKGICMGLNTLAGLLILFLPYNNDVYIL